MRRSFLRAFLEKLHPKELSVGLVRYGTNGDGGYLLPAEIKHIDVCFSAGVERNSDFEYDIVENFNSRVLMLDASVEGPAMLCENFIFEKKWLGRESHSETVGINEWVEKNVSEHERAILKLDIEGSEYEVFDAINIKNLLKFDCIICEFHAFENILTHTHEIQKNILNKILNVFDCVHVHPNNGKLPYHTYGFIIPSDVEFTFVRKGLVSLTGKKAMLPHKSDFDNTDGPFINLNWDG